MDIVWSDARETFDRTAVDSQYYQCKPCALSNYGSDQLELPPLNTHRNGMFDPRMRLLLGCGYFAVAAAAVFVLPIRSGDKAGRPPRDGRGR